MPASPTRIPSPTTPGAGGVGPNGEPKTKAVQAQVDEVVGIMQNNIEKVMERGEKLDSLATKTEDLQQSSMQFKRGATKVRKAMWWKDLKMKIAIAVVIAIILAIIIVPIVNNVKANSGTNTNPNPPSSTAPKGARSPMPRLV